MRSLHKVCSLIVLVATLITAAALIPMTRQAFDMSSVSLGSSRSGSSEPVQNNRGVSAWLGITPSHSERMKEDRDD